MPYIAKARLTPEQTETVVQCLGGPKEVAKLFGVTKAVPYQWLKAGMPDYRFDQIRLRRPEAVDSLVLRKENAS